MQMYSVYNTQAHLLWKLILLEQESEPTVVHSWTGNILSKDISSTISTMDTT
jgi:hypothetical protein